MNINSTFFIQLVFVFWLLPLFAVVFSRKVTGKEKIIWVLAVLFVSWISFMFYWLFAPVKSKQLDT